MYDTFTVGDGTGTAGALIDDNPLESDGEATWQHPASSKEYGGWTYDASGRAVVQKHVVEGENILSAAPEILTKLPDITGQVVTVEADIKATSDNSTESYVLLALSSRDNVYVRPDSEQPGSELSLRFYANGSYAFVANNAESDALAKGTVPGYDPAKPQFVHFAMAYDQANQTASLAVNGVPLHKNIDLSHLNMSYLTGPGMYAGFRAQKPTAPGAAVVDNFSATVGALPSPAADHPA